MKVIACSRVNIPTLLHPEVPYFVLVIEDENGNRYAHKSVTEKKTGEEINFTTNDNAVAIWRNKYDLLEAIEKVIALIGGLQIKEDSKILILPTLISPNHSYFRENTSPEFLDAILSIVVQKTKNIKVVGQSFNDIPIEFSAQKSGLLDVCIKYGIMPIDLGKISFTKQGKLEISKELMGADMILNIPIMKIGKISATENTFKLLSKTNYSSLKYLESEEAVIEELNKIILDKTFTIAEADVVQEEGRKGPGHQPLHIGDQGGKGAAKGGMGDDGPVLPGAHLLLPLLPQRNFAHCQLVGRQNQLLQPGARVFLGKGDLLQSVLDLPQPPAELNHIHVHPQHFHPAGLLSDGHFHRLLLRLGPVPEKRQREVGEKKKDRRQEEKLPQPGKPL